MLKDKATVSKAFQLYLSKFFYVYTRANVSLFQRQIEKSHYFVLDA